MRQQHACWPALRAAFPYTTPILAGFVFLGFAYGVYMANCQAKCNTFEK